MDIQTLEKIFVEQGGNFICPISILKEKISKVKAFVFDWDGVFNAGVKGKNLSSTFSEPDSLALNILRFGFKLVNQKTPLTGIITGMNNESAILFAEREHLNFVYQGFKNKFDAIEELVETYHLQFDEIAYCFDDVLDIPVCQEVGVRMKVRRTGSPLFTDYILRNKLADYITANDGTGYAVREISELILGVFDVYDEVITQRVKYSGEYEKYFSERNRVTPQITTWIKHDRNEM